MDEMTFEEREALTEEARRLRRERAILLALVLHAPGEYGVEVAGRTEWLSDETEAARALGFDPDTDPIGGRLLDEIEAAHSAEAKRHVDTMPEIQAAARERKRGGE